MNEPAAAKPLDIVILIDALGWEIVQRFNFCADLLPRSGPLDTVLGYSSAAIPSLLTGELPSAHGAWAMYRYAPEASPFAFLRHVPKLPHALEWRLRVLTKRIIAKRGSIEGYYDLYEIPPHLLSDFDIAQRGDPYTPGGMEQETLFDRLVSEGVSFKTWTYRTPESDNFDALVKSVASDDRFLFFYTADLDALMHQVGIFADAVRDKLAEYERRIRTVVDAASAAGRPTRVYLFSDHGMTDVGEVVDLMGAVESWGYKLGGGFKAFYDSTMARFWCDDATATELTAKLNVTGWGSVVPREELEAFGCYFEDRSYGDVIFLAKPGALIVPSFMSHEAIGAMHGYHPDDRYSRGCFMTNDPEGQLPGSIMDLKAYLLGKLLPTAVNG